MAKTRSIYVCQNCGASQPKWMGRCPVCQAWDTLVEERQEPARPAGQTAKPTPLTPLAQAGQHPEPRLPSGLCELDRVLGGGLVAGMAVVVGGEPGIGKSTLMLQLAASLSTAQRRVLYVSAEESAAQVGLRARRLGLGGQGVDLLAETALEPVLEQIARGGHGVVIVDSIQALRSADLAGAPGSVGQVRHCAAELTARAKVGGAPLLMVGHVTKDGALAGPRVLEHMVDTVLHFESEPAMRLRLLRAVKNRFGATDEVGVFEMGENGLRPVGDPSAALLAHRPGDAPGSVVCAALGGTRPLLVEVQALVSPSGLATPRRQALGVDQGRLAMLAAVLAIHAGLELAGCDIFVNVAGGVKLIEPAADLAVAAAIASSLRGRPVPQDVVCFGEVGLAGELRAVGRLRARLAEAARHGFGRAVTAGGESPANHSIELVAASRLAQALELLWP
ncbi:DNA repair protein RadA [Desulfarculus baarsii DSM 2075]|uniref:DNA repair protein RadA n=1 Tax=Desulfarculus baarsii (strain ATCC 33931 / DSM 2075 / LMG 7858 / VKM B-1802 / 2st14) TaxID=644282 RepID=E1QIT0_DESB2|nr:DNA repair protein RadA [Desulfarculus baarsii]ADK84503.1 DNA repair protein RadA [Desulfarculus baarsii DSM 2075]